MEKPIPDKAMLYILSILCDRKSTHLCLTSQPLNIDESTQTFTTHLAVSDTYILHDVNACQLEMTTNNCESFLTPPAFSLHQHINTHHSVPLRIATMVSTGFSVRNAELSSEIILNFDNCCSVSLQRKFRVPVASS